MLLLRKGLERFERRFAACRKDPSTENVHRLRKACRHLRCLFDVLRHWGHQKHGQAVHDRLRQLHHAIGTLRDLQVLASTLRELSKRDPALEPVLVRVLKEEREEREAVKDLLARPGADPGPEGHHCLKRFVPQGPPRPALNRALAEAGHAVRARWKCMDPQDPRSLHRSRIALRRYAHLISTMAVYLDERRLPPLSRSIRLQEQLGRLHDQQQLLERTAEILKKLSPSDQPEVAVFLERESRSIRRRRAAFIRGHRTPA